MKHNRFLTSLPFHRSGSMHSMTSLPIHRSGSMHSMAGSENFDGVQIARPLRGHNGSYLHFYCSCCYSCPSSSSAPSSTFSSSSASSSTSSFFFSYFVIFFFYLRYSDQLFRIQPLTNQFFTITCSCPLLGRNGLHTQTSEL